MIIRFNRSDGGWRTMPGNFNPGSINDDGFDVMWSFLMMGGQKANYPALKEACMDLRQMMMQKTAGQRKDRKKDLPWTEFEQVVRCIVIEAMALVLSGEWERLEEDLHDKH